MAGSAVAAVLLASAAGFAALAAPARSQVPPGAYAVRGDSIPASLTGAKGDPARGRAIVLDRHLGLCLLCHSGPFPGERLQGTIAPDLGGTASRLTEGQLRLRIADSSRVNPQTIMPAYYRSDGLVRVAPGFRGKTVLSAAQIEDVVAFLATLR